MANKKVYSIEINGISESVKQADSLLEKLNNLQERVKEIGKSGVKIKVGDGKEKEEIQATSNTLAGMRKELSQLKRELSHTELGTKEFDELRKQTLELNNQLKQVEQSYGVFSRNVGNYTNSFLVAFNQFPIGVQNSIKGLKSFNGEASTLGQQIKSVSKSMEELIANGKENSEEFQALAEVYAKLTDKQREFNDAIDDAKDNTHGLKDVVEVFGSLTGAMQLAAGASQLFGRNGEDAVKAIQKMQALQSVAQGLKSLQQSLTKTGPLMKAWNSAMSSSDKLLKALNISTRAEAQAQGTLSTATIVSANAMKALKLAIASTGIGLLVVAIGSLVAYMMSLADASEKAEKKLELIGKTTQTVISEIDTKKDLGIITALDAAILKLKEYQNELNKTNSIIDSLVKSNTNNNFFTKLFGGDLSGITDKLGKDFLKWKQITDKNTNSLEDVQKALKELDKFEQQFMDDAVSDDWLKILDAERNALKELANGFKEVAQEQKNATVSLDNYNKSMDKSIRNYNAQAMVDGYKKDLQMLKNNLTEQIAEIDKAAEEELKIVSGNSKQKQEVEQKAAKAREAATKANQQAINNLNKEWGNKRLQIENQIAQNEIASQRQTLAIRLREIELERKKEIDAAKQSNILVQEQIKSINEKYEFKRIELIQETTRKIENELKNSTDRINSMISDSMGETIKKFEQQKESLTNFRWDDEVSDGKHLSDIFTPSKEWDTSSISELIEFQSQMDDYYRLQEKAELDYYKTLKDQYSEYYAQRSEAVTQALTNEYNQKKQALKKEYEGSAQLNEMLENLQKEYNAKTVLETQKLSNERLQTETQYMQNVESVYENGFSNIMTYYRNFDVYLNELRNSRKNYNDWGIFDLSGANNQMEAQKAMYESFINSINTQLDDLQKKYEGGLISTETFTKTKEELLALRKTFSYTVKGIEEDQKLFIGEFIQSINQWVQRVGQAVQEIMSSVFETINNNYEVQLDNLDKETDRLEKILDKQKELVDNHNDKINDIEGELGSARGDRRDQLINALNAEKIAREEAYAEEKKIEKEKEKNEKKKEKLAKKQREEQKKQAIVQAIISTALATANGLATQPFMPVGIAMGALATTLGAVQIALISKQKYANGGVLDGGVAQGNSHAQGGIKVLGGRAEIEGGEFITNKRTTSMNAPLLEFINSKKKRIDIYDIVDFYSGGKKTISTPKTKYADGGALPTIGNVGLSTTNMNRIMIDTSNQPIVVSVEEINRVQENVRNVQVLSGYEN